MNIILVSLHAMQPVFFIIRVPFQAVFFEYAVWFVPFLGGKLEDKYFKDKAARKKKLEEIIPKPM